MNFIASGTQSYQTLISRRRSSVASDKSLLDSAPSSPIDKAFERVEPAVNYVYTCEKCGFGTNLLSSFMPHISNPCDQRTTITWGHL